ncbi:MAG: methyltransferase type 12, partial [Methylobacteriaceae bacterium]|nr:methyltransferase type 12 [Methylobacteriaceae bacterium]
LADPVGWLADIAACLREGGHLCLAVPDKRFTFDHLREPTLARELLGWAVERPRAPTPGQVYDHLLHCAEIDGGEVWLGRPAPRRIHAGEPDVPRRIAEAVAAGGERPDVHCTVWTPWSFARAWTTVIAAGLLPLALVALDPTRYAEIEFFATFRKLEASLDERARLAPRLDPAQHHALPGPPAPASTKPRRRWFGRD